MPLRHTKPKTRDMFKFDKTFSATKSKLHVESLEVSKVLDDTNGILEEVIDLNDFSLDNT